MRENVKPLLCGVLLLLAFTTIYMMNRSPAVRGPGVQDTNIKEISFARHAPAQQHTHKNSAHSANRPTVALKDLRMPRKCLQGDTSEEYYRCRRAALLEGCSEICDTSLMGEPSLLFHFVRKHVDCAGVWMNEEIDASLGEGQWPPPDFPPRVFLQDYQQHGLVEVIKNKHYTQRYSGGNAAESLWTEQGINALVEQARRGQLEGSYSTVDTNEVRAGLRQMDVKGKRVLVIGSERPWVEACALEAGAAEVWTLEYGHINCTHPSVFTMTPDQAREMYRKGQLPLFDAVLTYSSVEHSGLGRYGDALNPWGDKQAIARAWCVTKPGGQMLLAVMECNTHDTIEYNMHRCYNKNTYTQLTANWKQIYRGDSTLQPVMVFRKVAALATPRDEE